MKASSILTSLLLGAGLAGSASAAEILVTGPISTSTTWFATDTYNLQGTVYVTNNATLTIEPGTVIASDGPIDPVTLKPLGGTLVITRGAKLIANGTPSAPIICTSKLDVATWTPLGSHPTGGNPTTGTWRASANEWGNITMLGKGYISENAVAGNQPTPTATNVANMEGLTAGPTTDQYGGGDDNDDSGTLAYVSFRYGGKIISLANELNGLSLGGIGRETDIHHVEIMNNVDDGVEIWGGTVNLKNVSIWNIGDDSFDLDQGWRGKAQDGLIVQGYSLVAAQGSGIGDNCFEHDGAEQSSWQPVTTGTIYNFTVIGQPGSLGGDEGTAWRDGARLQYRNCVFMDLGQRLVRNDNVDGDGGAGYGFEGTLSFAATWTTPYNSVPAHANDPLPALGIYQAQSSGMLSEMRDSVFFRNLFSSGGNDAYTEAIAVGVLAPANNNVLVQGFADGDLPIRSITRGAPVAGPGGLSVSPVTSLDARADYAALTSVALAPNDGFFTPHKYRGAFSPTVDWQDGWTAADAFGFLASSAPLDAPTALDISVSGGGGTVSAVLDVNGGPAFGLAVYAYSPGVSPFPIPFGTGFILLDVGTVQILGNTALDASGNGRRVLDFTSSVPTTTLAFQAALVTIPSLSIGFSNTVAIGHGASAGIEGNASYNSTSQRWRAVVSNTTGATAAITAEFFDASAASTTGVFSGTAGANQSNEYQGTVDLEFGDTLTIKANGTAIATVIGNS